MRIQYISNACVLLEHNGTRILCDPWLEDGAFYSWFHYPPLEFTPEDFSNVDYIYISHIHPDHLDIKTLSKLPLNIKIIILEYEEKYLFKKLQSLGFTTILEIPHKGKMALNEDLTIELLAADNCDPILCGKTFGCRIPQIYSKSLQLDSLAIFHGSGKTLVNSNDCPYELAFSVCQYIRESYQTIDFLLVGYNSASPYPQCFDNYDDKEKLIKASDIKNKCLDRTVGYLRDLSPNYFLPFAGQYVLGGNLARLNSFRAVTEMEELPTVLNELTSRYNLASKLVMLNSGGWFDLHSEVSDRFTPPNPVERQRYIDKVLSKIKYPYENQYIPNNSQIDLFEKLVQAQTKMFHKLDTLYDATRLNLRLYINVSSDFLYCVPFDGSSVETVMPGEEIEPYITISLDKNLLQMILDKKAHWNNADIGSHLRYYRKPDYFDITFTHYLSYFHC